MSQSEKTGSIYWEMRERRSRSERLNALAVEKGLEIAESPEVATFEPEPEIEMKPAFDESEIEAAAPVMESELQSTPPEAEAQPAPIEIPSDAQVSELEESVSEEADSEATEEKIQTEELEEPETAEVHADSEEEPNSVREIEESESILGEEPQPVNDDEVTRVAEELVDRIGPVVDIQSLPKTQPSRILSKTAKPETPKPPAEKVTEVPQPEDSLSDFEEVIESNEISAETPKPPAAEVEPPASTKKKKKKISLLDSYFKGL